MAPKVRCEGRGLGRPLPGVLLGEGHLALQVGPFDDVPVDEADLADAGPHEVLGGMSAECSAAYEENTRGADSLLTLRTDRLKELLAAVA